MTTPEPTTEAGRALLDGTIIGRAGTSRAIFAIEHQAAERAVADERRRLAGLRSLAKEGAARLHLNGSGLFVNHNGTLYECEAERCVAAVALLSDTP